jgi:hypothetical protein
MEDELRYRMAGPSGPHVEPLSFAQTGHTSCKQGTVLTAGRRCCRRRGGLASTRSQVGNTWTTRAFSDHQGCSWRPLHPHRSFLPTEQSLSNLEPMLASHNRHPASTLAVALARCRFLFALFSPGSPFPIPYPPTPMPMATMPCHAVP